MDRLHGFGNAWESRIRHGQASPIWKISLYFPCLSGIGPQRRVRARLPPPPLSLPEQRLSGQYERRSEKSRDSEGFWRLGSFDSEPETAGLRLD